MFNSKLRKISIENYNNAVQRYEKVANDLGESAISLFKVREEALKLIELIEERINRLANSPKEFKVTLQKVEIEIRCFESKQKEIKKAEFDARAAAGSSGAGASLSALGVAVATMGPTAAMGIATTFGVASTGTAISSLSGAAATKAALAWLGGGALSAGGGGISAGTAFLGLAGPVGWTIAGVMLAGSLGSGLYASGKNKKTADMLIAERENIEEIIRKFNNMNSQIKALLEITNTQITGLSSTEKAMKGSDYSRFSSDEKLQAGLLVNSTLTLAQLVNKELKLDA